MPHDDDFLMCLRQILVGYPRGKFWLAGRKWSKTFHVTGRKNEMGIKMIETRWVRLLSMGGWVGSTFFLRWVRGKMGVGLFSGRACFGLRGSENVKMSEWEAGQVI